MKPVGPAPAEGRRQPGQARGECAACHAEGRALYTAIGLDGQLTRVCSLCEAWLALAREHAGQLVPHG